VDVPRRPTLGALARFLLALPASARAQDESGVPGWRVLFSSIREHESYDVRVGSAAFALPEGVAAVPEVDAAFQAVFATRLHVTQAGRYRLGLELEGGEARLVLSDLGSGLETSLEGRAGELALTPWLELGSGEHPLQLVFTRAGERAARLRTLWEREMSKDGGFPLEPIPARSTRASEVVAHGAEDGELTRRGRALLEKKGCVNCHHGPRERVGFRLAPPIEGPSGIGARLGGAWLERWILSPRALKPGADMPDLLGTGATAQAEARALAHYLVGLGQHAEPAEDEPLAREPQVLAEGRRIFHTRGCVACHGALESPREVFANDVLEGEAPSVDVPAHFGDLRGKWRPRALAQMLVDPIQAFPDGRMPSLGLTQAEADLVATYLLSQWGSAEPFAPDAVLAERGRELFMMRRCGACHLIEGIQPGAPALAALRPEQGGCLDPAHPSAPRYLLLPEERAALYGGIASAAAAAGARGGLFDAAQRTLERLSCAACHVIDGQGGLPELLRPYFVSSDERVDLGDEGRLPPDLSHVGFKLNHAWLAEVLARGGRSRTYLEARMPSFAPSALGALAEELVRREGIEPGADAPEPEASNELVLAGRALLGHENLGCMSCHVYRDFPPTGTPGADITRFAERLRFEWFRSFMHNPQRYEPGSRMPDFATGGLSSLRTVFDGDMARQIDALWAAFSLGDAMPVPEGVERGRGLTIQVGERPIVLRTFLEDVGSRGIAIGLQVGVHFAFDAERGRLAYAWRGDFLDASGAWAGRGGTIVGGQGPVVWRAPAGLALIPHGTPRPEWEHWPDGRADRFRGYRLDAAGNPSFFHESDLLGAANERSSVAVSEAFEAQVAPHLVLRRRIALAGIPAHGGVWCNAGAGEVSLADLLHCRVVERLERDGEVWFDLAAEDAASAISFTIEVRP
jgi:mono/diheme cytochrome c family protein